MFNEIYTAIASSEAYAAATRIANDDLPGWLVPCSILSIAELTRIARALNVKQGDTFVDLACGAGGAGIWVAEQTGAALVGIDFSGSAIAAAKALAARRNVADRASYIVADATQTGLPGASMDGAISIDAVMFIDPTSVAAEIARLLKPGGIAVITAPEALAEPFRPTLVRDYRPIFEAAGLAVQVHEEVLSYRPRLLRLYHALKDRRDQLRSEMGPAAEYLLAEASVGLEREHQPRVREMFLVAQRP